jgi:tetrahydromethanopterin S-methyltransferase subunit F
MRENKNEKQIAGIQRSTRTAVGCADSMPDVRKKVRYCGRNRKLHQTKTAESGGPKA